MSPGNGYRDPRSSLLRTAPSPLATILATVLLCSLPHPQASAADAPIIAVAASVKFAVEEIALRFTETTGIPVRLSFGSSGNIARQIRQGAPFAMILSADESYVLDLAADGRIPDAGRIYARGRIVVFTRTGSAVRQPDLTGLAAALASGALGRVALPNPDHAPYGRAAREALESSLLWDEIQPHLVYGENAGQAARFALSGSTDGAILPYSLVLVPEIGGRGSFDLIPSSAHTPLNHRMALLEGAGPSAEAFFDYLTSEPAQRVFRRSGLEPPPKPKVKESG